VKHTERKTTIEEHVTKTSSSLKVKVSKLNDFMYVMLYWVTIFMDSFNFLYIL